MSMRLHHETKKKALRMGLEIEPLNDGFAVYMGDEQIAWDHDPKRSLEIAEEKLAPDLHEEREEEDAQGEEDKASRSVVRPHYYERYKKFEGRCGDDVAEILHAFLFPSGEFSEEKFQEVVEQNGLEKDWSHLNIGMRRMNLSNVLRGMLRRGEPVRVGDVLFEAKSEEKEEAA